MELSTKRTCVKLTRAIMRAPMQIEPPIPFFQSVYLLKERREREKGRVKGEEKRGGGDTDFKKN